MAVHRLTPFGIAVVGWGIIVTAILALAVLVLVPSCYGVVGC